MSEDAEENARERERESVCVCVCVCVHLCICASVHLCICVNTYSLISVRSLPGTSRPPASLSRLSATPTPSTGETKKKVVMKESNLCVLTLLLFSPHSHSVSFNWSGSLLATTSKDKIIRVIDVAAGKVVSQGPVSFFFFRFAGKKNNWHFTCFEIHMYMYIL